MLIHGHDNQRSLANVSSSSFTFLPPLFSNLLSWYDGTLCVKDGSNLISRLTDRMGRHNLTATNTPLYVANDLNGYPAIRFNGINNSMSSDSFTLNQPFTAIMVMKFKTNAHEDRILTSVDGDNGIFWAQGSDKVELYAGTAFDAGYAARDTEPFVVAVCFNGANSYIRVNGRTKITGDANTSGWTTGFRFGRKGGAESNYFDGDLYEMLLYNVAVGDDVLDYWIYTLQDKYCLSDIRENPITIEPWIWLENDLQWITKDGSNLVSLWRDKSRKGYGVYQPTGTNQPAWSSGGITNTDVDNYLQSIIFHSTLTGQKLPQPLTMFAVIKNISWTNYGKVTAAEPNFEIGMLQHDTTPKMGMYAGGYVVGTDLTIGNYGLIAAVFNGASSRIRVNDGSATTGNPSTLGFSDNAFTLGRYINSANVTYKEVILYPAALSTDDETPVRNMLKAKNNLTF